MENIAVSSAEVERAFSVMSKRTSLSVKHVSDFMMINLNKKPLYQLILIPILNLFSEVIGRLGDQKIARKEEYSSRQAGVTTGIIAAVLVPILLVLVCVVYQLFVRNRKNAEQQQQQVADPLTISDPIVRHSEFDSDDLAPYKRNSDDSNTFKKEETEIQLNFITISKYSISFNIYLCFIPSLFV
uniref:Uncharacterized protein n=1 Tax=Timema bartmani TaxID=61472 RepID=A0A7R9EW76_9NEOP|nr:unnamed protein product [Timema bartmani]